MDPERFDALARTLNAFGPRRAVLRALAGGALGSLAGTLRVRSTAARPAGASCSSDAQCDSGICRSGRCACPDFRRPCGDVCCVAPESCHARDDVCVHYCQDARLNFDETDIDCGGSCPTKCPDGDQCNVDGDCDSGHCVVGICQECLTDEHCRNQPFPLFLHCHNLSCVQCVDDEFCRTNFPLSPYCVGNECAICRTNADCPPDRPRCGVFRNFSHACHCRRNRNCPRGQQCDELAGQCVPPATCTNGVKNRGESDVDCGGSCPTKCANGQHCRVPTDCMSGACADVPGQGRICVECTADTHCPNDQPVCVGRVCIAPAVCAAGIDVCAQGFSPATACRDQGTQDCFCHTTTEGETRCLQPGAPGGGCLDRRGRCDDSAQCVARFGPGAVCVRDTGNVCQCQFCKFLC